MESISTISATGGEDCVIGETSALDDPHPLVAATPTKNELS